MYKVSFFVPKQESEKVKIAMFEAGAGRVGRYDRCSFETLGTGQFRPLEGSDPFLGKHGQVEYVQELKVEMVCKDDVVLEVVKEMIKAHPYEEVAYDVIKLVDLNLERE